MLKVEPNVLTPPPSPIGGITARILIVTTPCDPHGPLADYATVTIETGDLNLSRAVGRVLKKVLPPNTYTVDSVRDPERFGLIRLFSSSEIEELRVCIKQGVGGEEDVAVVNVGQLRVFRVSGRFIDNSLGGPFRVITLIVVTAHADRVRSLAAAYWLKLINEERTARNLTPITEATPLILLTRKKDKHAERYDEWGFWIREVLLSEGTFSRIPYTKPPSFVAVKTK